MSQKKLFLVLAGGALFLGALWLRYQAASGTSALAPDFQLSDLTGRVVSLSQFRGRPVLVNFWATWCPACREEIPALESVYERQKASGFTILGISVDEGGKSAVLGFLAGSPVTYPILLCDPRTADAYHIYELPNSFLIGPDGKIIRRYLGPIDPKSLENDILSISRQTPRRKI